MKLLPDLNQLSPEGDPIDPYCTFDAFALKSPTGFTWRELEEHRTTIANGYIALGGVVLNSESLPDPKEYKSLKKKKK